jgi:tRNA(fMet)-specific endonuclease VapC
VVKPRFLLDTSVLSEPLKGEPHSGVLERLKRHSARLCTCTVVWHELSYGAHRLPTSKRREAIQRYLGSVVLSALPIFSYDLKAAEYHATARAHLASAGLTPSFADGQIASIAVTNELVLVTRNVSDFKRFADLTVQNWFDM